MDGVRCLNPAGKGIFLSRPIYFEDLRRGMRFPFILRRTFTEENIKKFSENTGDFNPLHLDGKAARNAGFENIVAQGCFTDSVVFACSDIFDNPILCAKDLIRFLRPVLAGGTLSYTLVVFSKKDDGSPRGGRVKFYFEATNQDGTKVTTGFFTLIVKRRAV